VVISMIVGTPLSHPEVAFSWPRAAGTMSEKSWIGLGLIVVILLPGTVALIGASVAGSGPRPIRIDSREVRYARKAVPLERIEEIDGAPASAPPLRVRPAKSSRSTRSSARTRSMPGFSMS